MINYLTLSIINFVIFYALLESVQINAELQL
jgi:hypothetical protein